MIHAKVGTARYAELWEASRIQPLPPRWAKRFIEQFKKKGGSFSPVANSWLRETTERYAKFRVDLNSTDDDIINIAKQAAKDCFTFGYRYEAAPTKARLIEKMSEYCRNWKIEPVEVEDNITPAGAIGRMSDELWWRRQLRKVHARELESEAIRLGFVHRRAGVYCSNETLARRTQQRRRNKETMEGLIFENEMQQQFTMAELAERSVANPAIRRGELMCRIAGFESCAKYVGHVGEFVTLTCPSEYHARLSASGEENPNYSGKNPREAQAYLQGVWAKIRASMARAGVRLYGFRIAEPHHDATPHWHMLFFMAPEVAGQFKKIVRRYALESAPDEPGAQENRVKFIPIDWQRGTAAGYLAKYVAKNIDGQNVGMDLEGSPAIESALRVDAWAATWRIRQFQQIGGPPIGVWRELRRIGKGATVSMERARSAADSGNFGEFTSAMGGPLARRIHFPIALKMKQREETNRYGEPGAWLPCGVKDVNSELWSKSRRFTWRLIGRSESANIRENSAAWSPVNNCTRQFSENSVPEKELIDFSEIGVIIANSVEITARNVPKLE